MKTLKTIMAVAIALLITACGGKKEEEAPKKEFDIEKAQKLADRYYQNAGYNEKEWNDFAEVYAELQNTIMEKMETAIDKAPAGESLFAILNDFNEDNIELGKIADKMRRISSESQSIPADVAAKIKESDDSTTARAQGFINRFEQKQNQEQ